MTCHTLTPYILPITNLTCFTAPFCVVGYEYCVESTMGGFGPVEKTYHLSRRRRWTRQRSLTVDAQVLHEKVGDQLFHLSPI